MAVRKPDSPAELLKRFLDAGWEVVDEGELNWLLANPKATGAAGAPFVIPKDADEIGIETMRQAHEALGHGERNQVGVVDDPNFDPQDLT